MTTYDVVGYTAAVLGTIAYAPQAFKVLKSGKTTDISLYMYIILVSGLATWSVFGLMTSQWHIFGANIFALTTTIPVLYLKIRDLHRERKNKT